VRCVFASNFSMIRFDIVIVLLVSEILFLILIFKSDLEITTLNSTAIPDPVQKLFIFVAERRAFQQVRTVT